MLGCCRGAGIGLSLSAVRYDGGLKEGGEPGVQWEGERFWTVGEVVLRTEEEGRRGGLTGKEQVR